MRPCTRRRLKISGYLARRQAGELALDVEMARAGDHVLAAYQSEQQRPVIVAEEVDALQVRPPSCLGLLILSRVFVPTVGSSSALMNSR